MLADAARDARRVACRGRRAWHSRNPDGVEYAATTAGELAQLWGGRRRLGGKDIAAVHRALADPDLSADALAHLSGRE